MGVVRRIRARTSSGDGRSLPPVERFPHLAAFLSGYLHQDFLLEHGTPAGALRAFLQEAGASERDALQQEWRAFIGAVDGLRWRDVREAFTALGGSWRPGSRADLLALFDDLVDELS